MPARRRLLVDARSLPVRSVDPGLQRQRFVRSSIRSLTVMAGVVVEERTQRVDLVEETAPVAKAPEPPFSNEYRT